MTGGLRVRYSFGVRHVRRFRTVDRCASVVAKAFSDHPVEHHHVHLVAHGDVALAVVQHDEAVGFDHGAQHARTLIAGRAHTQASIGHSGDDAALVFGAAGFLAQGFGAAGFEQHRFAGAAAHHALQGRAHEGQEGDHHGHRVAG